jgi:diguanylate cyclase (GGDEF)-like protein/PAS domain S-box-containing protein
VSSAVGDLQALASMLLFVSATVGVVELIRHGQRLLPRLRGPWAEPLLLAAAAVAGVSVGVRLLGVLGPPAVALTPLLLAWVGGAPAAWAGAIGLAATAPSGARLAVVAVGAAAGGLAAARRSPLWALPLACAASLLTAPTPWTRAGAQALAPAVAALLFAYYAESVDRERRERLRLQEEATTDPLTGAWNRQGFAAWLREHPADQGALCLVDVDDFKLINEAYGHAAGDAVLRELVARIREVLGPDDFLVRLGGDEFVAVLPRATARQGLYVAGRLRAAVGETPFAWPGSQGLPVRVSVGVAEGRLGELLGPADAALLSAKAHGKNRVEMALGGDPSPAGRTAIRITSDLARVLAGSPDGYVLTDLDHRFLQVTPSFLRMAGLPAERWAGGSPRWLASGLNPPAVYRELRRALAEEGSWHGELIDRRPDGSLWWAEWSMVRVEVHGRPLGYVGAVRDRTAAYRSWTRLLTDVVAELSEGHEPYLAEHLRRTGAYLALLAAAWQERYGRQGLDVDPVDLALAARLHDVGKLGLPTAIFHKAGPLTETERRVVRLHPERGVRYLDALARRVPDLADSLYLQHVLGYARAIALCHHERWDGGGYPQGLRGEAIPVAARLFAVVDVYDALRTRRTYKPAWDEDQVLDTLRAEAGRSFDPRVVDLALELARTPAWRDVGPAGPSPEEAAAGGA